MADEDEGVRAAARAVRWFLPELVGAAAPEIDAGIAGLLAEAPEGRNIQRLRELLERREETSAFLEVVLNDAPHFRPPQVRPSTLKGTGYSSLPGVIPPVGAPRYRCPVGDDYDWWQLAAGDPVPACPTHACALVLA